MTHHSKLNIVNSSGLQDMLLFEYIITVSVSASLQTQRQKSSESFSGELLSERRHSGTCRKSATEVDETKCGQGGTTEKWLLTLRHQKTLLVVCQRDSWTFAWLRDSSLLSLTTPAAALFCSLGCRQSQPLKKQDNYTHNEHCQEERLKFKLSQV